MSEAVDVVPYKMDAAGMTLAHRPRLYWCDWELLETEGVHIHRCPQAQFGDFHVVQLEAELNAADFLELGGLCKMSSSGCPLSRPSPQPGRKPAGLTSCSAGELERWAADQHRFPPYQYKDSNCLRHRRGDLRIASLLEREVIMGMPAHYTQHCWAKSLRGGAGYVDARLTLVGNAWAVPVVPWLGCFFHPAADRGC